MDVHDINPCGGMMGSDLAQTDLLLVLAWA